MFLWLWLALWKPVSACEPAQPGDPLQAYVVTTGPGEQLFTLMGHTALWVSDPEGRDRVFNWGAFDSTQENLVGKFLHGELEYYLMTTSWARTRRQAERYDRELVVQRLDLPPEMLAMLRAQLTAARRPENKGYAYHWLERNCTSKVRDLIDLVTGMALSAQADAVGPTPRNEVLRHLHLFPLWFGWHFAASDLADAPLTGVKTMLTPDTFMEGLSRMELTWPDGGRRPLVAETCTMETGPLGMAPKQPPSRNLPLALGSLLVAGMIGLGGLGSRPGRWLSGLLIMLLGLVTGAMGSVSWFLWLGSSLDGFGTNENWWVASPASLLLLPAGLGLCLSARWTRRFVPPVKLLGLGAMVGVLVNILPMADQVNSAILITFVPPILAAAWVFHRWAPARLAPGGSARPDAEPAAATPAPPPDRGDGD